MSIMGIAVKRETTCCNLFAIFFIQFLVTAKYGFLQAQMYFLLESDDLFGVEYSELG